MTALVDSMIFLIVMMAAIAATISIHDHDDTPDEDPDDFLGNLSKVQVRLSDFTPLEDDSLVYMADVLAYSASNQCRATDYLSSILDRMYGQHRYCLEYSYQGSTGSVGDLKGYFLQQSTMTISVSTGGDIDLKLSII
jgi:hypothetical protein